MINHTAPQTFSEIGDLGRTPLSPDERERRTRFALLWEPLVSALKTNGWSEFHPGSVVELYVSGGTSSVLQRIWLSPTRNELRVRLDFVDAATLRRVFVKKEALRPGMIDRERVAVEKLKRSAGTAHVLEVRCSLGDLLEGAQSGNEMANRLRDFALAAIDGAANVALDQQGGQLP